VVQTAFASLTLKPINWFKHKKAGYGRHFLYN
jgi:hypothetical protein